MIHAQRHDLDTDCELVWIELSVVGSKPILVGSFYRPPSSPIEDLNMLRTSLARVKVDNYSNVWLGGDFNLGDIIWETQSVRPGSQKGPMCRDLIDIANDCGFEQVVEGPTRGKNTLDLLFVKNPSLVVKSGLLPGISDHDGIPVVSIHSKPSTVKQKPRKIFLYNKANIDELKADINEISSDFKSGNVSETDANALWIIFSSDFKSGNVSETDANALWIIFKTRLLQAVDKHVPSKMVRKRNYTPWINQTLKRLHKRKQRAYNRARKSNSQEDWESFKELRRKIKKATRKAYRGYIRDKCLESSKQFWSFIKSLKNDSSGIPALKDAHGGLVTCNRQKAELLNCQYQKQFTQERLEDLPTEPESNIPSMPNITIREEGVCKLLSDLNPFKATGPDEISPWVLKTAAKELSPALTVLFQLTLDSGVVPEDWLCANITPIYKKGIKQTLQITVL
ncbi:uncharacterized protein [Amphiura filiformis]|uniref:uncharacterized protein n=1 Tax=Amphiura filiformis TaxID=82378 RepID=UPI003B22672A